VRRLALRPVFLAFDYGEQGADTLAHRLARELVALGATPYRLTPPAGAGDWNDRLQAVGLEAMRAELSAAILPMLVSPLRCSANHRRHALRDAAVAPSRATGYPPRPADALAMAETWNRSGERHGPHDAHHAGRLRRV
jgi:hypothetical protein